MHSKGTFFIKAITPQLSFKLTLNINIMDSESLSTKTIIKNETQRLNLNAAQIPVALPVLALFPRACNSCFSEVYKYTQY